MGLRERFKRQFDVVLQEEGRRAAADPNMPFGQRLRSIRRADGLSLDDLAKAAGLNKSTLSRLETGLIKPTSDAVLRVSRALGIPPYILRGNTAVEPGPRDLALEELIGTELVPVAATDLAAIEASVFGRSVFVAQVPIRFADLIPGELLIVDPHVKPEDQDFVLFKAYRGVTLFQYHHAPAIKPAGIPIMHYQKLVGHNVSLGGDSPAEFIGVVVETRRPRKATRRTARAVSSVA